MVSSKQKIQKIFLSDEEIAEEMMKEASKKRFNPDWARLLHYFRIHSYSKSIKSHKNREVLKCSECGQMKCIHHNDLRMGLMFSTVIATIVGIGLALVGWGSFLSALSVGRFARNGFIFGIIFAILGYLSLKYALEHWRMPP